MNEMSIKRKYVSEGAEVVDVCSFADASLAPMWNLAYFRYHQTSKLANVVRKCRVAD